VGETTAKYLAEHFRSMDAVMHASREELIEAEEVGGKIADAIVEYFADKENIRIIERLRKAGLRFEAEQKQSLSESLAGKTFVISGTFADHSRDELKALIEAHGGKNLAAVSANTSYLLAGDKIGPAKLQKATKLGINIISEDDFMAMIADAEPLDNNISKAENEESAAENPAISEAKSETTSQAPIQGTLF
jgi:DNA ligase (NAD+)